MSPKVCYMSVVIPTRFSTVCVDFPLEGLLGTRVLKCFLTPTVTYAAEADETMLHICIETQQVIDYMC